MITLLCLLHAFTFPTAEAKGFPLHRERAETLKWQDFLLVERRDQTRDALDRAEYFVPLIRPLFRAEGVPEDLVWLALIESSFRNHVESPTGAVGMFQFKRETATAFGLVVRGRTDQRLEPIKAGAAAARYLRYLRGKFASWDLVLAAYNLGEGDLRRTMAARNSLTWEEVRPFVREETQNYVEKIRAAAIIGNRHLGNLNPQTPLRHTVLKGDTLYSIARTYGVPVDELRALNGLVGNHISPGQALTVPKAAPKPLP
ncbi:transglycosylase SLT domain-containing protein [Acanthopleuribacter pedis]|uniref:Transglycosylase SLT domain-containing protein n=1 Tax=Acanthopleuribacter pedis TaxID=442870 RepID=A0A8J7Q846_9BACT|nr:transglycosylase SLT domain-containing protein [Acanthopleuribacter pedis]MBO1320191.1 transglycosylase SLT domain-containing protein [Acanthopleuribacter pedis]